MLNSAKRLYGIFLLHIDNHTQAQPSTYQTESIIRPHLQPRVLHRHVTQPRPRHVTQPRPHASRRRRVHPHAAHAAHAPVHAPVHAPAVHAPAVVHARELRRGRCGRVAGVHEGVAAHAGARGAGGPVGVASAARLVETAHHAVAGGGGGGERLGELLLLLAVFGAPVLKPYLEPHTVHGQVNTGEQMADDQIIESNHE